MKGPEIKILLKAQRDPNYQFLQPMEIPSAVEKSKRLQLHLPYLRWGQHRFIRCVKLPVFLTFISSSPSPY
ncbi:unnamed protein product [Eruca vesicaria subsp. sativa]|uniref:Uncharacterized protein n=1 Tax=Eruca vesicaria subsp. sativa TaxID=29727 RepID=A0ABC8M590_ERUVS|nr:unnamed protein product [Eruca vesicaria subsp. sativa]